MNMNKTIFRVHVSDIQDVAEEKFGTRLTESELEVVIKQVQEKIVTYDVIADAVGDVERVSKMVDEEDKEFFETYHS